MLFYTVSPHPHPVFHPYLHSMQTSNISAHCSLENTVQGTWD